MLFLITAFLWAGLFVALAAQVWIHWDITREGKEPVHAKYPRSAYSHAMRNGPSDETRTVACLCPNTALDYAEDVDRGPCDQTRDAVCGPKSDIITAYLYALYVDKTPHPVTWARVKGSPWEGHYRSKIGEPTCQS